MTSCLRRAMATASERLEAPSFEKIVMMMFLTVLCEMLLELGDGAELAFAACAKRRKGDEQQRK